MKNELNICKTITIILAAILLLTSCSSNRLPFIITAQYADRPVLIGQYKKLGEKIDPNAPGIAFESNQGTYVLDMRLNKLSRDILMLNPKKNDIFVVQEINVDSSTLSFSTYMALSNNSVLKGKILEGPVK